MDISGRSCMLVTSGSQWVKCLAPECYLYISGQLGPNPGLFGYHVWRQIGRGKLFFSPISCLITCGGWVTWNGLASYSARGITFALCTVTNMGKQKLRIFFTIVNMYLLLFSGSKHYGKYNTIYSFSDHSDFRGLCWM